MKRVAILGVGLCLLVSQGSLPTAGVAQQVLLPLDQPAIAAAGGAPAAAGPALNVPQPAPA